MLHSELRESSCKIGGSIATALVPRKNEIGAPILKTTCDATQDDGERCDARQGGETDALLSERATTHGLFQDNSEVSQSLQNIIFRHPKSWRLTNVQREAMQMFCHKIGRILSGNPDFADHWADIAGYARLAEKGGNL